MRRKELAPLQTRKGGGIVAPSWSPRSDAKAWAGQSCFSSETLVLAAHSFPQKKPLPTGSEVSLSLRLGSSNSPVSCRAKVIYVVANLGMGVQFVDLSEEARRAIEKFVDDSE